jgi:hypothetical protein
MEDHFEHKFAIRRITKETDSDYIQALRIYNDIIPVETRTNTNEITHWLKKDDVNTLFKTMLFILYLDNKVVGFSMMSYLAANKIIVIEYLALELQYRINSVFLSYIGLLQDYLREFDIEVSYYVTDISNKGAGKNIDKESKLFRKLICLEGFGRINTIYYTPPLGLMNHESEFESFLYIKTNDSIKQINRETYLDIVRAIYYDYYYEWYKDFLLKEEYLNDYKQRIDSCFASVKKNITDNLSCEIIYAECPFVNEPYTDEKTHGPLPIPQKDKSKKMLFIFIPLLFIVPLVIILPYNFILKALKIPLDLAYSIISGYFTTIVTALSTYFITRNKL